MILRVRRVVFPVLAVAAVLLLASTVSAVLSPVLFAVLLAVILNPVVNAAERIQLPRVLSVSLLYVALIVVLVFLASMLLPFARRSAGSAPSRSGLVAGVVLACAVVSLTAQHVFLAVASPELTGISTHRCGWCVVEHSFAGGAAAGMAMLAVSASLLTALSSVLEHRAGTGAGVSRALACGSLIFLLVAAALGGLAGL